MGKGEDFERELCKELSLWWTQDLDEPRDDIFWRTSGSGARATARMKKGKLTANSYGDMMAIDPIGQPLIDLCFFEFKRGYTTKMKKGKAVIGSISILDFLDKKGKIQLLDWWREAEGKMSKTGQKHIILIFRRDRHEGCVMVTRDFESMIEGYAGGSVGSKIRIEFWEGTSELRVFLAMKYSEFFAWFTPTYFEAPEW